MKKLDHIGTEELLGGLGRLLGEPDTDEGATRRAELERLTRRELPESRLAELEREARDDPALRRALEAHRPLEDAALERIERRVLRPSARARRALWGLPPALAAAAALLLWLRAPSPEPLAAYRLEVSGAVASARGVEGAERSGEPAVTRLGPERRLELLLRPALPDRHAAGASVFLEQRGERRPLPASVARSESGALRLALELPALSEGAAQLLVVVARPEVPAAEAAAAEADHGPGWQRFELTLEGVAPR